jgi:hypothetical protein
MPTEPLLIDPFENPDLKENVSDLAPTPGYCIFIDIVGSTAMKQQGIHYWVAMIYNCFTDADSFFINFKPLKSIGDELMYFIEATDLAEKGESALFLYDSLYQIAENTKEGFPETKICAAFCSDAYPLTFLKGTKDYYGIDIDRAARLKGNEVNIKSRQVVIDAGMHERVMEAASLIANKDQFSSLTGIKEEEVFEAKGISDPIRFYRINAMPDCEGDQSILSA